MKFQDLNLNKGLFNALADLNLTLPTAIQYKAFAPIMSGRDVIAISQTGTGKTFAYLLPLLRLWKFTKSPFPQILIIVPTRELVVQVKEAAESLTTYMNVQTVGVYGGTNMNTQAKEVLAGLDIIVGTPGRLTDLIKSGALKTKNIKRVVIDEVDEMLNLGFRTQLRLLNDFLPQKRQHLMFSATMSEEVEKVVHEFTDYYLKIETAPSGAPLENIKQIAYNVPNFNTKINLLSILIENDPSLDKVLIFVKSKKMADALFEKIEPTYNESLGIIHSSKAQNNRFNTVNSFHNGTVKYLIATDIIARGIDITDVTHVINFDLPENAEQYIHRIGRTGRSEKSGISISFISDNDVKYQNAIEDLMDQKIEFKDNPNILQVSEELIQLEKLGERIPLNLHKVKITKPTGGAFHEKKAKNKKVNNKIRHEEKMKKKYGKPKSRGKKR